jgi:hypothetical protein
MDATCDLPAPFVLPKATITAARGKPAKVSQILAMQKALMAVVMDTEEEANRRASCACAWEKLEAMLRKIRGLPDPGHLRPEAPKPKRKSIPLTGSEEP